MAARKSGLGRGLDALIPQDTKGGIFDLVAGRQRGAVVHLGVAGVAGDRDALAYAVGAREDPLAGRTFFGEHRLAGEGRVAVAQVRVEIAAVGVVR